VPPVLQEPMRPALRARRGQRGQRAMRRRVQPGLLRGRR
jgi:hypothetical protein